MRSEERRRMLIKMKQPRARFSSLELLLLIIKRKLPRNVNSNPFDRFLIILSIIRLNLRMEQC